MKISKKIQKCLRPKEKFYFFLGNSEENQHQNSYEG